MSDGGAGDRTRSRRAVYGISVASELSGFGIQALRLYEQYGLVAPARTSGGTRRYSDYDLARLRRIADLIEAGVNLVGIGHVLDLERRNNELERHNLRLKTANARLRAERISAVENPLHTAPEADRFEQSVPADPALAQDRQDLDGAGESWDAPEADRIEQAQQIAPVDPIADSRAAARSEMPWDAPEADRLEQLASVGFDDDDRAGPAHEGFEEYQE
ncbi:MerR family transcriptional regulator [Rhodococcus chondri]|uniref:MerR family transcriptional regulator n=1 Tax=Rhodococcus chondri TaxID=3065941 RepID=UPI0038B62495